MTFSRPEQRLTSIALALSLAAGTSACRDVAPAFGPDPAAARAGSDGLFGGIALRFTNVQRNPKFSVARGKLAHNALTPSRVYNDTAAWTAWGSDSTRTLTIDGEFASNRYLFAARPWPPAQPNSPGDSRHLIRLRRISEDEFEWLTNVDIAVGSIRAAEFHNVISALLASAENRSATALRADYRIAFPRATASFGRLFTLETLTTTRGADGATAIQLGIRIVPARLRSSMPNFAAYLDKYAKPSSYRAVVTDSRGGRWIELAGADNLLTLRLRAHAGHFAPLNGPPRPVPSELQLTADFRTRILLFTVGFRALAANVSVIQTGSERGWLLRFTEEPDWRLPPTVARLLRTPLRRPFEGQGTTFRLALRDNPAGGQSIIGRRTNAVVQESAILRFLGRLSSTAMDDFVGKAEAEENRFSAEAFRALQADVRALLD